MEAYNIFFDSYRYIDKSSTQICVVCLGEMHTDTSASQIYCICIGPARFSNTNKAKLPGTVSSKSMTVKTLLLCVLIAHFIQKIKTM